MASKPRAASKRDIRREHSILARHIIKCVLLYGVTLVSGEKHTLRPTNGLMASAFAVKERKRCVPEKI